jgi:hypothetical protein
MSTSMSGSGSSRARCHLEPHSRGAYDHPQIAQFKTGAASLLRDEDVVPALAGGGIPDH